ncbi:threonine-phosphate decarboxylase [Endozoicomonas sp. OPT23]|uniref:threonine-phosphate decarboxylase CobD n=1 Tax=Endozoicomonas sp. OPT23 TaxID=2072845 RepID=UPI00129A3944|nr:threonine-phosphate decarboxylase CobD [Endozoicomonas sp. OPT23]MRI31933.1 threonine-phosphate decarboxylase [Endozoicomonas sp. OPT23]
MTVDTNTTGLLNHGGKLNQVAEQYDIPAEQWLDLSTGVNPRCYPVKDIPVRAWNRLPEDDDGLVEAACDYYQTTSLLPVAGTQAAIQALPLLIKAHSPNLKTVALPDVGYREHANAWRKNGFEVVSYHNEPSCELINSVDILLVINPNNPTTFRNSADSLLKWHQALQQQNGLLIIDEAFMDSDTEQSISHLSPLDNLIVLRSVGKFFGLAGIRAGFVLAEPHLLNQLQTIIGPWTLSGPAREICKQALSDNSWQENNRQFLHYASQRLSKLLSRYFGKVHTAAMFVTVKTNRAEVLHNALCEKAIFTRLLDEKDGLRFGLPDRETDWQQLSEALYRLKLILIQ